MTENITENVLEGIVGFTAVITLLMIVAGYSPYYIKPDIALPSAIPITIYLLFLIVPLLGGVLFLYKLIKGKVDVASPLLFMPLLFSIIGSPNLGFLNWAFLLLPFVSGIILLLQAFDFIPAEEKGEIKF